VGREGCRATGQSGSGPTHVVCVPEAGSTCPCQVWTGNFPLPKV
jgi:hypothetical protein